MANELKRILILDGISSQALPIMRHFYKSGHKVYIVCPHRLCAGYFSRYVHKKIIWPSLYNNDNDVLNRLISYLASNKIDLVLGLSDKTANIISKNNALITQFTKTLVPNFEIFKIASDKWETMKFCMQNSIPCPKTLDGDNIVVTNIEKLMSFPLIVKPKKGVGSVGVFKYYDPKLLKKHFNLLEQAFGSLIIQEYIPNSEQYTVESFSDWEAKVRSCVVIEKSRFYPVSGGTSSCNVTVYDDRIKSVSIEFLEKLLWIGNANLDIIMDPRDQTPKIIEINPRVGSMVRIAFESGVNVADIQYQMAFNSRVDEIESYKSGIVLRNLLLDTLWLFSSPFKSIIKSYPSYFSFFGSKICFENFRIDDPLIAFGYFLGIVRKYMNTKNFKKKFRKST